MHSALMDLLLGIFLTAAVVHVAYWTVYFRMAAAIRCHDPELAKIAGIQSSIFSGEWRLTKHIVFGVWRRPFSKRLVFAARTLFWIEMVLYFFFLVVLIVLVIMLLQAPGHTLPYTLPWRRSHEP